MKIKLSILILWLLLINQAQAASIRIWPIKILLWPEQASDSVRLTNEGDEPVSVQLSAKSWDIDENGKFVETDTGDFVFFPHLLTLPPHEEKSVRVGYQGNFPAMEKPYRLYVDELPPVLSVEQQKNAQKLGVTYRLKLSVPIFVMPSQSPPAPEIQVDGVKTGVITVTVNQPPSPPKVPLKPTERTEPILSVGIRAPGTHHIQISKVETELFDTTGKSLGTGLANPHILRILPKRRVFVDVPMDTKVCGKAKSLLVKVYAESLQNPYEQRVSLTNCRG